MFSDLTMPWLLSVALLTVRLTVALALSPPLSAFGVPVSLRVALTLVLAGLTFVSREPAPMAAAWAHDPGSMLGPVMAEVFIGALLGLGVHVVLAALALAGRLMDVQTGFAIGSVFDPVTGTNSNVIGSMTALLGVVAFVLSNAHLKLAQLVSFSLEVLPLGTLPQFDDPLKPLLAAGSMFSLGLALAAPVAIALLLTDLVIGVASRNMPQVNVFVLAIPIKVLITYLVLGFSVIGWSPLLERYFNRAASAVGLS